MFEVGRLPVEWSGVQSKDGQDGLICLSGNDCWFSRLSICKGHRKKWPQQ